MYSRVAVMKSGLNNDDIIYLNEIDQSMLLVDSSRPASFEDVSKRFWFTDSVSRVTQHVFQESIQTFQSCSVMRLPIAVVLPANRREYQTRQDSSCSSL
jgi:hypothetical protein